MVFRDCRHLDELRQETAEEFNSRGGVDVELVLARSNSSGGHI
jgi:hypothetical protein